MAIVFSRQTGIYGFGGPNQSNCDMFFFNLKTFLKANGWTVVQSCDGTTVNSTSDIITQAGSGTGGMNNINSWFVIQAPTIGGKSRQFCFHKVIGSNILNNQRMMTYSVQGFSTTTGYSGAISASNPPIAFDGIRTGNYSDGAANTPYQAMASASFAANDHNYWETGAGSIPAYNYWGYLFYTDTTTGSFFAYIYDNYFRPITLFGYDVFSEYDSNDPDPCAVIHIPSNTSGLPFGIAYWSGNAWGLGAYKYLAMSWFRRPATFSSLADSQNTSSYYQVQGLFPMTLNLPSTGSGYGGVAMTIPAAGMSTGLIPDQYTRAIPIYPLYWVYQNPTNSLQTTTIKGKSNFMSYCADPKYANATLSSTTPRNFVCVGDPATNIAIFVLPWDGTVPLAP